MTINGKKVYLQQNVYELAQERVALCFDNFEIVMVSFSGGKDSGVLLELAGREARKRGRKLHVLIVDLEAQYEMTIKYIEQMVIGKEWLVPVWVCLPLNLRNAVSVFEPHWCCWDQSARESWVRDFPPYECVLKEWNNLSFFRPRMEFEEFIVEFPKWFANGRSFASLVAIRTDESLNRYKAVARPLGDKKSSYWIGDKEIRWGTVMSAKHSNIVSLYPIYDWGFSDVMGFYAKENVPYNPVYDTMFWAGIPYSEMRICQPYGDDQRKGLDLWHKMEPQTWPKIIERVPGVNYGAKHAGGKLMGYHRGMGLPEGHTWKSYTFFLLSTLPHDAMRERYLSNFAVFLEWWGRNGYSNLDDVFDDETAALKSQSLRHRLPSWRRLALAILKNDFLCKSLSIGQIKDVFADVYDRVANGKPVKVRKSVVPVYEYLREQYALYLDKGITAVTMEFDVVKSTSKLNGIKEKYKDI